MADAKPEHVFNILLSRCNYNKYFTYMLWVRDELFGMDCVKVCPDGFYPGVNMAPPKTAEYMSEIVK